MGAGALHRYTKTWDQPLQRLAEEDIEKRQGTVGVQELNTVKAAYWGGALGGDNGADAARTMVDRAAAAGPPGRAAGLLEWADLY